MTETFGRLAALRPQSVLESKLYVVPAGMEIVGNLIACNQKGHAVDVSVALSPTSASALPGDWILFNREISSGAYERINGLALSSGQAVKVMISSASAVSFVLFGMVRI